MEAVVHAANTLGVESASTPDGATVLRVPCAKRAPLSVIVTPRERTLALRAFVIRAPDRNHDAVYRRLLRANLDPGSWRFSLDDAGDIFAVTDVPRDRIDPDRLDTLLGELVILVDERYEGLFRTGFDVPDDVVVAPPPQE